MNSYLFKKYFVTLSVLLTTNAFASDLVVITAKDNAHSLDIKDVSRIFLGKITQYPNGEKVTPLDINPSDPSYEQFARVVLKKNPSQLRAYWAKRVFTGKGKPPKIIATTDELLSLVSSDKQYLSYTDKNNNQFDVRWVIEVNE